MAVSRGTRLLLQRARPGVVMAMVAMFAPGLAIVVGVPACAALIDGEFKLFAALIVPTAVAALVAWLRRNSIAPAPRRIEALVAVAFAFALAAALAVPALVSVGFTPADALFEAVSGITTTGLSTAPSVEGLPVSAHFLRVWLQWVGGFAFASVAIALIVGPGVIALRLGMVDGPDQTLLGSARNRTRAVLGAYLVVSVVAMVGAGVASEQPLDGAMLALAAVSTGGFALGDNSLADASPGLVGILTLTMLAGAVSMTLLAQAWRDGIKVLLADPELRVMMLVALLGATLIVLIEALRPAGIGFTDSLFSIFSAQTTAGFATITIAEHAPASILVLIVLMGIGGSVGSTAGGLKVFRFAFATTTVRLMLLRAGLSPKAVVPLRVFGRKAQAAEVVDVFALLCCYGFFVAGLWFALVLAGYEPLHALFDTVSAFSTVGLSAGVVGHEMHGGFKVLFALAMLMGRLEFLAVLALLSPLTWVGGSRNSR